MDGDDELARLQQFRVGAGPAIGTPEDRVVMQVEGKPVIGTGFDVLQMPPARREVPDQFERHHAVKRRVEDAGDQRAHVRALQVRHEPFIDEGGLRIGLLAVRRSGTEAVVRAVQHPVLAGQHRGGHLIIRRQLHEHFSILTSLPEHGIGIGQLHEPPAHITEKKTGVLACGQLRGQRFNGKRPERAVGKIKSVCHKKPPIPVMMTEDRRLCRNPRTLCKENSTGFMASFSKIHKNVIFKCISGVCYLTEK